MRATTKPATATQAMRAEGRTETTISPIAQKVQSYNIPPMMTLADGQKALLWTISGVSAGVGVISGFLGVGGGFVRMPAIYYVIGTSLAAAVGTSLFTGLLSGGVGAFTYGRAGVIDLGIVTALLLGSALSPRIGSGATAYVNEDDVTIYFGIMLLIASIAVALGEAAAWLSMPVLDQISFVLLVGSALFVCATILYHGALAVRRERGTPPSARASLPIPRSEVVPSVESLDRARRVEHFVVEIPVRDDEPG